jgi:hypothetical protein
MGRNQLSGMHTIRTVREGVATASLKFHPGLPSPTLIRPAGGPQGGRPAAVFFPLGYPFPYGPAYDMSEFAVNSEFQLLSLIFIVTKTKGLLGKDNVKQNY